jgi:predicted permease
VRLPGRAPHVLPESAIPGLNAYVLYFALPCMLFRFGMNTPILDLLNPGCWRSTCARRW